MADRLDEELKAALLKRALGYEYEERVVTAGRNGGPEKVRIIKKHIPPDLKALAEVRYLKRIGRW